MLRCHHLWSDQFSLQNNCNLNYNLCRCFYSENLWFEHFQALFWGCHYLCTLLSLLSTVLRSSTTYWIVKSKKNCWHLKFAPAALLNSASFRKQNVLCMQPCYSVLEESAKWCWSILAKALMKRWVFPGSRWNVLLGNLPGDRRWGNGLMSSLLLHSFWIEIFPAVAMFYFPSSSFRCLKCAKHIDDDDNSAWFGLIWLEGDLSESRWHFVDLFTAKLFCFYFELIYFVWNAKKKQSQ